MKSVAIVGLGWLGLPLARHLQQLGWQVKGSKRSHDGVEQMRLLGLESYYLLLQPEISADPDDLSALFDVDALVINIPPSQYFFDIEHYEAGVENVVNEALMHGVQHLIFISSTSVFPEQSGLFDESILPEPDSPRGEGLYRLERHLLTAYPDIHVDVIRFAGLVGADRHPVHYLSGRTGLQGGNQPVNLVHVDDCARAIQLLLESPGFQRLYHLSTPKHPAKADYYSRCAEKLGLNRPHFFCSPDDPKRVIAGDKICRELGFVYFYPDPDDML